MSPRGTFGFSKKRAKILRTIETVIPRSTEVSLLRLYSRGLCAPCTDRLDCMSRTAILVACKVPQRPSTGLPAKACQRPISVYRGSASQRIAAHRSASRRRPQYITCFLIKTHLNQTKPKNKRMLAKCNENAIY